MAAPNYTPDVIHGEADRLQQKNLIRFHFARVSRFLPVVRQLSVAQERDMSSLKRITDSDLSSQNQHVVFTIWVQFAEGVPPFIQINQNDYSGRKHIKQKVEDIPICECKYDANDHVSACSERCLNVLTSTECVPGYCPCGDSCKNQRFQKSEYAKTRLFKTEGRGWGLLADEMIKVGQFIIEYCGEVISSKEANQRFLAYESEGLRDAYIISLNSNLYIDATRKGSFARFINHSCQPNCETRKWTVLGETRVGIFAKQDICAGTELGYDYNFEWYGGDIVRCLCGAPKCTIFLGAKSQGFKERNDVWEDGDDRYKVDEFPLSDSGEDDEPSLNLPTTNSNREKPIVTENGNYYEIMNGNLGSDHQLDTNSMGSEVYGKSMPRDYNNGSGTTSKKRYNNRRQKHSGYTQFDIKRIAQLFSSKQAREEILKFEEERNEATLKFEFYRDKLPPAIEEHERDDQDEVPTSLAEKWIEACRLKLKADLNLYHSIVKNKLFPPPEDSNESNGAVDMRSPQNAGANHSTT